MKNEVNNTFNIKTEAESNIFKTIKKIIGFFSLVMMIFSSLTQKTFACSGGGYPASYVLPVKQTSKKDAEIKDKQNTIDNLRLQIKLYEERLALKEDSVEFWESRFNRCNDKLDTLEGRISGTPRTGGIKKFFRGSEYNSVENNVIEK